MKTKTPEVMKTTAKEIKATNALRKAFVGYLRDALTINECHALGMTFNGPESVAFDVAVSELRALARSRIESQRMNAAARSPLIAERYVDTLSRGLVNVLGTRAKGAADDQPLSTPPTHKPWASVTKDVLHVAYMSGAIPALTLSDAHPGSRAGVIVVDLRDLKKFSTRKGALTPASIRACVNGEAQP